MGKKIVAAILGTFLGTVAILVLLLLAEETPLLIYTTNKFQIFLMMFFILSISATFTEVVVGTSAWEVIVDMILVLIVSIIWANISFEFSGARDVFEYLETLIFPIGGTAIFAAFFSKMTTKKLQGSGEKK